MKRIWRKLYRRELLPDFVISGIIVFWWGVFLLLQVKRLSNRPVPIAGDIAFIRLSAAALLAAIVMLGAFLYKKSMSYIRWYQGILDSIPIPVIVTGKDASWQYANERCREIMDIDRDAALEKLSSGHLIDADGGVMKKTWIHKGAEYRTAGSRLCVNGKDAGYLLLLYNVSDMPDSHETRTGLLDEINRLLGNLATATDHFHDCASSFAGSSIRQEGIIVGLSEVITEIASGSIDKPEILDEKMHIVKADMRRHVDISQAQLARMQRTVAEIDTACDSIGNVLRDIHNIP